MNKNGLEDIRDFSNFSYEELNNYVTLDLKGKSYNTKQIWNWVYKKSITSFEDMTNVPKKLSSHFSSHFSLFSVNLEEQQISNDGTIKYLLRLNDGQLIETVLIPEEKRVTVCISSQVGCKFNCSFCATGKLGFKRNLSTAEIVSQILLLQNFSDRRITNIVYMGMGEPFDNYDNVIKSANILNNDNGFAIGSRKITISTVGHIDGLKRFIKDDIRYRLAVSLHSPNSLNRSKIVPINKKYPLEKLFPLLKKYAEKSKRKVVFEYVMLNGITDNFEDANLLIELLSGLPSKLNLIKFHSNEKSIFKNSEKSREKTFYNILQKQKKFPVVFRTSRGEDIDAACGQLANSNSKKNTDT